jgi:hypothetical protein
MRRAGDTRGQMTHLDPDVLAEFRAGLVTGRRVARISAHLAACDRCTALSDELAQVSALLAAVPGSAVPDSVAQRLDIALAAEVANRDYSERTDGHRPRTRRSWRRPAWTRDFRLVALRVLAPAAVVLLAAGGYELTQHGGPAMQAAASSAGHAASTAGAAANPGNSAAAPVAAPDSSTAPTARPQRMSPAAFQVVVSPTNFQLATFKQQVEAALAVKSANKTLISSATLRACVHAVARSAEPALVESAHYRGQPATLIVVPAGSDDVAWLVGPRCSATSRDPLTHTTVPSGISGP